MTILQVDIPHARGATFTGTFKHGTTLFVRFLMRSNNNISFPYDMQYIAQ